MSVFTNLLNLFKWEPEKDGEEEFDIDKALNENWDKLDNKIDAHTKNTQLVHKNATADLSGFMSKEDKEKLDNIEKEAQSNVIEKIQKNGKDISIANKIVNIVLNKKDVGLNNVDNTADLDKPISTAAKKALNNKVDKEEGKGLSTNDYTNEDKAKLIPTGGTTGQVLAKKSDADNDVEWVNQTGGGSATGDTLPVGSIMPYPKATAPENWLICDGSAISRTDYSELFNAIGTTFGEGDGSTTFNLPNIKGRTIVGLDTDDTDFNTIGKTLGEKTHTLTVAEMPEHNHKQSLDGGNSGNSGNAAYSWSIPANQYLYTGDDLAGKTGGSQPHNNIQPSFVATYIIKAKQSAGVVATVVNSLESTSATDALSAKQGKELNEKITRNSTYSTEEQAVGTWIDGKTIYRKIINFGALPNATKKEVQHNISNISNFTKIEGIAIRNDETKFTQSLPLVYKNAEMFYNTALAVDNTIIEIQTAGDRSMFNGYVTLEYTKTVED
jgi:microcystin-dependent protein|nr:MAG TPA_asm: Baseplate wedge protein [Caudoviricetes sp.]